MSRGHRAVTRWFFVISEIVSKPVVNHTRFLFFRFIDLYLTTYAVRVHEWTLNTERNLSISLQYASYTQVRIWRDILIFHNCFDTGTVLQYLAAFFAFSIHKSRFLDNFTWPLEINYCTPNTYYNNSSHSAVRAVYCTI